MISGKWLDGSTAKPALNYSTVCAAVALCLYSVSNASPCFAQDVAPAVEFDSGNFLLNVKTPPGLVAAELRSSKSRGGATTLVISQEMTTEFKDDGRPPDRLAKDGVYSGFVPGDIKSEVERYERLSELLKQDTPIPISEGRDFKGFKPSSAFIEERTASGIPILGVSPNISVSTPHSIAITDLSVIEAGDYTYNPCAAVGDKDGVWTFGHLMKEIADSEGVDSSTLCRNWLEHWAANQVINGYTAPQRAAVRDVILSAWDPNNTGVLSMQAAPFRLLGIFNRVDLRRSAYDHDSTAGELRFVYCFNDHCSKEPRPFLVIFEYRVNKVGCDVRKWGTQWADLSGMSLGSPEYLSALAKLTTEVTDLYSKPNGHRLAQLRTNAINNIRYRTGVRDGDGSNPFDSDGLNPVDMVSILKSGVLPMVDDIGLVEDSGLIQQVIDGSGSDTGAGVGSWELREFVVSDNGFLVQKSVVATPDNGSNGTSWLAGVIDNGPLTPLEEGASSINDAILYWHDVGVTNLTRRHKFSLNTCNSCHGAETETIFTHVRQAPYGVPPQLSDFLTGGGSGVGFQVADPVDGTVRTFNDLERRRQDLQNLIDTPCLRQILERRTKAILSH